MLKHRFFNCLLLAAAVVFISCNGSVGGSAGVKKDLTTGLTSTYKNMVPEKVLLIMNDEELHHNDIPLGEKFLLVNEGVRGLKQKDGKVSVGCALKITDQKGKILLDAKDLFQGEDIFDKDSATVLRCMVTTGEPMQWEEKYDVHVKFWDKYGDGNIDNKVTIRAIDVP